MPQPSTINRGNSKETPLIVSRIEPVTMKKKLQILLSTTVMTVMFTLTARGQSLSMRVVPDVVVEGEMFRVIYELENARANDIRIDEIDGCNKLSGPGITSSSYTTIINGNRTEKSTYSYAYTYRAIKTGTHTISPATFVVDGKEVKSKSATIKVLPPDQSASQSPSYSGTAPSQSSGSAASGGTAAAAPAGNDHFLRMNLNKTRVYEHEAIECTLTLYTREQQPNLNYKTPPSFDGFLTQDVDNFRGQPTMDNINGKNYIIYPLRRYILFPQKTGKLEVNPGALQMTVAEYEVINTFFGRQMIPVGEKEITVTGSPSTVNVQALPSPAPLSFNGAVGRFTLETKLNPEALRTNEAATLEILITGTGNIANIKAPQPEFPIDFEQYTPSEDVATRVSGSTVTGSIKTEYTFVPQSVGTFEIPAIEFSYFDPSKKDYVTLTSGGYTVDVTRGAGVTTGIVEQEDIARRATDILHIHKSDPSGLSKSISTPVVYTAKFWIIWIVIVGGAIVFLLVYRKEKSKRADVAGMKTARAGRVAKKRLRLAKKYMDANDSEAFHAEVLRALWGYIADRLTIPLTDLNRANVSEKLAARGLSEQEINHLINILDECEMARYTPESDMRDMSAIYTDASDAMDYLSKLNKK